MFPTSSRTLIIPGGRTAPEANHGQLEQGDADRPADARTGVALASPTAGSVANFGFAVNNRKKNTQTGEWEDEPVFLDCEAFNRGETGKTADLVEQFLHKGSQAFLEGHLKLDKWDDKATGEKRQKIKIVVEVVQFLDPKPAGEGGATHSRPSSRAGPGRSGSARPRSRATTTTKVPASRASRRADGTFRFDDCSRTTPCRRRS